MAISFGKYLGKDETGAVTGWVGGDIVERTQAYVGCVIAEREYNGANDSDFYALVWDDAKQEMRWIEWGTTRFPNFNGCHVDATEETLAKARAWAKAKVMPIIKAMDESQAKKPEVGKIVKVVKGRDKAKQGKIGRIVLSNPVKFGYHRSAQNMLLACDCGEVNRTPCCPICDASMRKRSGVNGEFWGCSRFPGCRGTLPLAFAYGTETVWTYDYNVEVENPEQYMATAEQIENKMDRDPIGLWCRYVSPR